MQVLLAGREAAIVPGSVFSCAQPVTAFLTTPGVSPIQPQAFRPITLERPKALLPLCNVPMIEYVLEFLSTNGVEEVFVFCCAHAEQIVEYLENSPWCQNSSGTNFVVHTVVSTNCISAGEALRLIDHRHVIRADFVLMHGDVVANMDLKKVLHAHNARRKKEKLAIMTLCFKPTTQALRETRFGEGNLIVVTDPDTNRVLHYETHAPPNEADSSFGDGEQKKAQKKPQLPPLSLDASLFSDHPSIKISTDLLDCHVDICAPEVLYLFTDNFDYQNLRRDFVVGTLNERELVRISQSPRSASLIAHTRARRDVLSPTVCPHGASYKTDTFSFTIRGTTCTRTRWRATNTPSASTHCARTTRFPRT